MGPGQRSEERWAAPERHRPAVTGRRKQRGRGRGLVLAPTDRGAILAHEQVQARAEGESDPSEVSSKDEISRPSVTRTNDVILSSARLCHRILRGRTWGLHG